MNRRLSLEADACGDRGPEAARAARRALAERGSHTRVDHHTARRGPLEGAAYALDILSFQSRHPGALERLKLDDEFLPAMETLRRTARGRYVPASGLKAVTSLASRFAPDSPGSRECFAALDEWRREGLLEVTRDGRTLPPEADLAPLLKTHVRLVQQGRLDLETPPTFSPLGVQAAQTLRGTKEPDPHLLQGDAVPALIAAAEARETPEAVTALTAVVKAAAGDPTVRTLLEPHVDRLGRLVSRADARQTLGGPFLDARPEAEYLKGLMEVFPQALGPEARRREVLPLLFMDSSGSRAGFDLVEATPGLAPAVVAQGLRVGFKREHWDVLSRAVERGEWNPSDDEIAWMAARLGPVPTRSDTDSAGAVDVLSRLRKTAPDRVRVDGPAMLKAMLADPPQDAADRLFGLYNDVIVGDTYELIFPDARLEQGLVERLEAAYAQAGSIERLEPQGQAALAVLASLLVHGIAAPEGGLEDRLATLLAAEGWRAQRTRCGEWLGKIVRERDVAASGGTPLAERAQALQARGADPAGEGFALEAWRARVREASESEVRDLALEMADRVLPGGSLFELAMLDTLAARLPEMRDRMLRELAPFVGQKNLGFAGSSLLSHARARLREGVLPPSGQALCLQVLETTSRTSSWSPQAGKDWAEALASWEKGLQGWMADLPRVAGADAWKALGVLVQATAPREPGAGDLARLGDVMDIVGKFDDACREYRTAAAFAVDGRSWTEAKAAAFRASVISGEPPAEAGLIEESPGEVRIGGLSLPVRQ